MRSLFGLVLLIAGLGLGAYSYFPETAEEHIRLVQLSRYVIPVAHDPVEPAAVSPLLAVSANSPLFGTATANQVATSDATPVVVAREQLVRPSSTADAIIPALSGSGPLSAPHPSASVLAARAYDVQQELKRVGCYYGYLDGDWGPASRRAMQAFLTKVNATLPVDRPDDILLALLRSQPDGACTNNCPAGQTADEGGRCTSNVVSASTTAGQGGNATASMIKPRQSTNSSARATSAPQPSSKDANDDLTSFTPVSRARADLPGRMSVGGPLMAQGAAGTAGAHASALPDLKPASKAGNALETASIAPSGPVTEPGRPASRETRPTKTAKKRYPSRKRYSQKTRQKRLMRQAFGEIF